MTRAIHYTRQEMRRPDEQRSAPLEVFVYDVPGLDGCGVFPPLHVLNQVLAAGQSGGGMSPGARWEPFQLTEEEYAALLPKVLAPDLGALRTRARFARAPFKLDPTLDSIQGRLAWLRAACDKHREAHLREQWPQQPTLFISVIAPGSDTAREIAELPLERRETFSVLGQQLPHPPGMRALELSDVALDDGVAVDLRVHLELETRSYGLSVLHGDEVLLQATGCYAAPEGAHGGLLGPDLSVQLPSGHLLGLRIFGPADASPGG